MGQLVEFASNHPFLVLGLVAAWIAVMAYEIRLKNQSLTHVSAADAVRLINKGAIVVDVREPQAYEAGHIANARNVTLSAIEADGDAIAKKKDRLLLTVCENGSTSGKAANRLRKAGYDKVFSLQGGLNGWREQNLPLVK